VGMRYEGVGVNHTTCIPPIHVHAGPCSCNSPSTVSREGVVGVVEQVIERVGSLEVAQSLTRTPRHAGTYALPPPTTPNFGLSFSTAVNLTEMATIKGGIACMT